MPHLPREPLGEARALPGLCLRTRRTASYASYSGIAPGEVGYTRVHLGRSWQVATHRLERLARATNAQTQRADALEHHGFHARHLGDLAGSEHAAGPVARFEQDHQPAERQALS